VLPAGSGFSGATAQPPAVGAVGSLGYDAKAIGRWDVVPYQTFSGDFNVGVVAFDIAGIDHVDFSLNGGAWTPVTDMQLNPQTGVWEYTATVRASTVPDGLVEVRAIVYPRSGVPRVLGGAQPHSTDDNGQYSCWINANSGGTVTGLTKWVDSVNGSNTTGNGTQNAPFATIKQAEMSMQNARGRVDDCTIYLKAGTYAAPGTWTGADPGAYATSSTGWLTVSAAPGLTKGQVVINSGVARFNTSLLRLKGLTLTSGLASDTTISPKAAIWFDGCDLHGTDYTQDVTYAGPTTFNGGIYETDSTVHDCQNGPYNTLLARNVAVSHIASDAFQDAYMIVNGSVTGTDAGSTGAHPDVAQWYHPGDIDNIICYGVIAKGCVCQGLFSEGPGLASNVAYVNVDLAQVLNDMCSQFGGTQQHVLLWNISMSNQSCLWRDPTNQTRNLSIRNSAFKYMADYYNNLGQSSVVIDNNHFVATPSFGTHATTGNPGWTSPDATWDLHPMTGSPLRARVSTALVPCDAEGHARMAPSAVGALEP
jgi:hypothetical protein